MARRVRAVRAGLCALGLGGVGFGVVAGVAVPGRAAAHASIETTVPAASATLERAPADIVLDFDEPVETALASVRLYDDSAEPVPIGDPTSATGDSTVVLAELPDLDDGVYAVVWRVSSVDGHIIDGSFSFRIGPGSPVEGTELLAAVSGGASPSPTVVAAARVARLLGFVGLAVTLAAGGCLAVAPRVFDRRARRVVAGAWAALVVATLASFGLYGASAVGGSLADALSPQVWREVVPTRPAVVLLIRAALAVASGAVLWAAYRRPATGATAGWRTVALVVAAAAVLTHPAAGHPSTQSLRLLWVVVDAVHLAAVSVWLGSLLLLASAASWRADRAPDVPLLRRFSAVVTALVPLIVVTGVAQTLALAGGIDDLTHTRWGRTLVVKLVAVAALLALGVASRRLLGRGHTTRLRRTVLAEAVVGVVVLGLAAVLVSLPPNPPAGTGIFNVSLAQAGMVADLTLTPGRVGDNQVHLVLSPPGGSLSPVAGAVVRIELPGRGIPDAPVALTPDGANHFTGAVTVPLGGDWKLDVVVEVAPGNTVLFSTTVPIP